MDRDEVHAGLTKGVAPDKQPAAAGAAPARPAGKTEAVFQTEKIG